RPSAARRPARASRVAETDEVIPVFEMERTAVRRLKESVGRQQTLGVQSVGAAVPVRPDLLAAPAFQAEVDFLGRCAAPEVDEKVEIVTLQSSERMVDAGRVGGRFQ